MACAVPALRCLVRSTLHVPEPVAAFTAAFPCASAPSSLPSVFCCAGADAEAVAALDALLKPLQPGREGEAAAANDNAAAMEALPAFLGLVQAAINDKHPNGLASAQAVLAHSLCRRLANVVATTVYNLVASKAAATNTSPLVLSRVKIVYVGLDLLTTLALVDAEVSEGALPTMPHQPAPPCIPLPLSFLLPSLLAALPFTEPRCQWLQEGWHLSLHRRKRLAPAGVPRQCVPRCAAAVCHGYGPRPSDAAPAVGRQRPHPREHANPAIPQRHYPHPATVLGE